MPIDKYVQQVFPIECMGRDINGNEVLAEPVEVKVRIYKFLGNNTISSEVECPYNTGGHRQRCKASHPKIDKILLVGEGVGCPYSFDIPYALEKKR